MQRSSTKTRQTNHPANGSFPYEVTERKWQHQRGWLVQTVLPHRPGINTSEGNVTSSVSCHHNLASRVLSVPQELKHLVLEAADGFLFVVSCETGRVVFVSDSVTPVLNQAQSDWLGSSLYDQLHPDDTEKLREQLSTAENNNTGATHTHTHGTTSKTLLPHQLPALM